MNKPTNKSNPNMDDECIIEVINLNFTHQELVMIVAACSVVIKIVEEAPDKMAVVPGFDDQRAKQIIRTAQSAMRKIETILDHDDRIKQQQRQATGN